MGNQYNILIDFVGILMLSVIFVAKLRQRRRASSTNDRLLYYLIICCALIFTADIAGLLLDGNTFAGAKILLWFFAFAYRTFQILYCMFWLLFSDYWALGSAERLKKRRVLYAVPMAAEMLLIFTSPLTGWLFTIDEANVCTRGSRYFLCLIPYAVYIAAAVTVTVCGCIKNVDDERKRSCVSLLIYMFLPFCAVLLDTLIYDISLLWMMVALSLLMVYMHLQQRTIAEEQLAAAKLETELAEGRIAIMLSQIQPHFLYNALNTIYVLCLKDPKVAAEAVDSFARFLRGNMDSLTKKYPVPFEKELDHLKYFLTVEKLRFPDISVEFDIKSKNFTLPSLTIQPIVENSIHYGVGCRPEGGTVTVSSWEDEKSYRIRIADNGEGFDPEATQYDGRSHIGIDNTRERLASMSGGSLSIKSEKGVGTTVEICLPKEMSKVPV